MTSSLNSHCTHSTSNLLCAATCDGGRFPAVKQPGEGVGVPSKSGGVSLQIGSFQAGTVTDPPSSCTLMQTCRELLDASIKHRKPSCVAYEAQTYPMAQSQELHLTQDRIGMGLQGWDQQLFQYDLERWKVVTVGPKWVTVAHREYQQLILGKQTHHEKVS